MLYCNRHKKVIEREIANNVKINTISCGERGRGRWEILIPVDNSILEIENGMNPYSVSKTRSNRPRIVNRDDGDLYFVLSTECGYTRRGNGEIFILKKDEECFELIGKANGADGAAGRIGQWDEVVFKLKKDGEYWIYIKESGACDKYFLYVKKHGNDVIINKVMLSDVAVYCDAIDIDLPFYYKIDEYGSIKLSNVSYYGRTEDMPENEWLNVSFINDKWDYMK